MAEEFINDIIGDAETPKTETETKIATELQETEIVEANKVITAKTDKTLKPDESKVQMGSEATPAVVQPLDKDKTPEVVVEVDAVKELAGQLGWREDHQGDDAVDAKTYILKSKDIQKSMSQHNKDLKDQLQTLGGSVDALKKHNKNVYQTEVKRLTSEVDSLKKERRAAIELADVTKVDELDKQIDDKQKDLDAPKPVDLQEQNATDNPIYDEWVKDNDWYLKDNEMASFADIVAQQYTGAPLDRVYKIVRNKVQEVFPDKFEVVKAPDNEQQEVVETPVGPTSPVESSSAKIDNVSFTKADLTSDQLQIMNQFVKGGIMTEEKYINDISKMQ